MGSIIGFIAGSTFVFLILTVLENRGKLRWIRKFGNPQIGGRSSPKDPTGITTKGNRDIRCGTFQTHRLDKHKALLQKQDNTPKKFLDPDTK